MAVILTRKPRPVSALWQPLKPFSGAVWALLAAVITAVAALAWAFDKVDWWRCCTGWL